MEYLTPVLRVLLVIVLIAGTLYFGNRRLIAFYSDRPHLKFRQQLLQLAGALVAVLLIILLMPLDEKLRTDLLSLYGLIISATIALSSTTMIGNVMAGIMLKVISSCRPGDFITVGDHFGRVTEMDLLHTEIQTEERDLTTLPNMFLVTNPVRVMQKSGTIMSVEVSLGYDVSRHTIEEVLLKAAAETGLEKPYVQIVNLGDFSVSYRVSGMFTEVNRLLDKRRELRTRTMDGLHARDIEIVSPSFMNTRNFDAATTFIPEKPARIIESTEAAAPDEMVFDKAEEAESVEKLRESMEAARANLKAFEEAIAESKDEKATEAANLEKQKLEAKIQRLQATIADREKSISDK